MANDKLKQFFIDKIIILTLFFGLTIPAIADFVTTEILARQGDTDAQYRLALMYDYGEVTYAVNPVDINLEYFSYVV